MPLMHIDNSRGIGLSPWGSPFIRCSCRPFNGTYTLSFLFSHFLAFIFNWFLLSCCQWTMTIHQWWAPQNQKKNQADLKKTLIKTVHFHSQEHLSFGALKIHAEVELYEYIFGYIQPNSKTHSHICIVYVVCTPSRDRWRGRRSKKKKNAEVQDRLSHEACQKPVSKTFQKLLSSTIY